MFFALKNDYNTVCEEVHNIPPFNSEHRSVAKSNVGARKRVYLHIVLCNVFMSCLATPHYRDPPEHEDGEKMFKRISMQDKECRLSFTYQNHTYIIPSHSN